MEVHIERGRIRALLPYAGGVLVKTERDTFTYPSAVVLPGFVDAHVHLLGLGKRLATPSLHNATSAEDCIDILLKADTADEWLFAMGWNQERWMGGGFPTARMLDDAFPTRPVVCSRIDGHALWVNSVVLRRAGIDGCSGVLVDDDAKPVWRILPAPSRTSIEQNIIAASRRFATEGVTEVHDMDVSPEVVAITRELAEQGKLAVRVQSFVSGQNHEWVHAGLLPAGGELQRTMGIKMYADGALGSRGAAFHSPYNDAPTSGALLLTANQIVDRALQAVHAGWWSIAVHAIGDLAVQTVLDAFATVRATDDGSNVILRIEHAQHMTYDDVQRCASLNVIASVQPTHAESDALMVQQRLGANRLADAYRWKSLLNAGVPLAFGTDAPIEEPSVLRTLDAATNRTPHLSSARWHSAEALDIETALQAASTWAHAAADMDYRRGELAVGYDADLVILDRNPGDAVGSLGDEVQVLATFTAGVMQTP